MSGIEFGRGHRHHLKAFDVADYGHDRVLDVHAELLDGYSVVVEGDRWNAACDCPPSVFPHSAARRRIDSPSRTHPGVFERSSWQKSAFT